MRIQVNNSKESLAVQEKLFAMGIFWGRHGKKPVMLAPYPQVICTDHYMPEDIQMITHMSLDYYEYQSPPGWKPQQAKDFLNTTIDDRGNLI